MSAMPQEVTSIVEACKSATARYQEAMVLTHQAQALTPGLSIWLRIEDELVGAFLDAERNAAKAIAEHMRRVLGPRGLPLPADTFVDLMPEPLDRQERRALALRMVNRSEEAPTTIDLESLWHAMLARFPSEEAAHDVARFALAKRFREAFFGRRYPAPEPHRDGIKMKLHASQDGYWLKQMQYSDYSANQLFAGLDLIAAIAEDAGQSVPVGRVRDWRHERPYLPHQRLDIGAVQVVCRKHYFELQLARDLSRAVNLFLASHPPHAAEAA